MKSEDDLDIMGLNQLINENFMITLNKDHS